MDIVQIKVPLNLEGDEPRVDSRVFADQLEIQHKNILSLISDYGDEFEELGRVAFRMATLQTSGGPQKTRYAELNEDQSYFLLTLTRSTPKAVPFKLGLVKAFRLARDRAQPAPALSLTPAQLSLQMAQSLVSLEQGLEVTQVKVQALEQRLDDSPIRGSRIAQIHALCKDLGRRMGDFRKAYRTFYDRFSLAAYRDLPDCRFEEAVNFLSLQIQSYAGPSLLEA